MNKIETKGMVAQFGDHLNDKNNRHIIFSGSFGSGKTTFLNDFFQDPKLKEKYYVCKLFPVNYVTSNNQDIYELMKFDVLLQLLGSGVTLDSNDFDKCMAIGKLGKKHFLSLTQSMIEAFSLVSGEAKIINKALGVIAAIYEGYKDEKPQNTIGRFLTDLENKTGTCYELNSISLLIREMLVKASKLGKEIEEVEEVRRETVLLIDDFDRLEPMQSFRLLNILSTNDNETNTGQNKFGFDKIIVVCDINNLRDCFKHINGTSNAFNGYIDKFYSTQIFYFDIKNDLVNAINSWFHEIAIAPDERSEFHKDYRCVFQRMIDCGELNIRSLTKMKDTSIVVPITNTYRSQFYDYLGLFFAILRKMFVGDKEIANAILLCASKNVLFSYKRCESVVNEALCIMHPKKKENDKIVVQIGENEYTFKINDSYWGLELINREAFDSYNVDIPLFYFIEEVKRKYLNI